MGIGHGHRRRLSRSRMIGEWMDEWLGDWVVGGVGEWLGGWLGGGGGGGGGGGVNEWLDGMDWSDEWVGVSHACRTLSCIRIVCRPVVLIKITSQKRRMINTYFSLEKF